ncbi:MAG: tryptophan 7-halogenase [Planctomycetes bacterium]|nr:tryptophan 7-halogenase [Planctomycetota bacterium]
MVDATGAGILSRTLDIPHDLSGIRTCSRTLYSHFEGVRPWRDICTTPAYSTTDHPFPIDDATLHHVFDGGWMWVIRFDNGITSAGLCLEPDTFPLDESIGAADEWNALMARFPSIREQFAAARPVLPFARTGRLQRNVARAAGKSWAMLPTTAGFIDAFFSTGNAHTLLGVIRLADILTQTNPGPDRDRRLADYDRLIRREIETIDRLVHGCYRSFKDMNVLSAYSMLYFLAATYSEERLRSGASAMDTGFLLADDDSFQKIVREFHARMGDGWPVAQGCDIEKTSLLRMLKDQAAAYNVAGLCDEGKRNMYPYSVA